MLTTATAPTLFPPPPPLPRRSSAGLLALALLWVMAVAPAVVPLFVILRDGVDVPFFDQWDHEMMDASLDARRGHVSHYLFEQHNEHRVFVPKLFYMVIDPLSHGNVKAEMLAEWVVVLATSLVVLWLLRNATGATGRRPVTPALLWLSCNLLIFSPVQLENWLWGVGLMNVLPMAFIAPMLGVLHDGAAGELLPGKRGPSKARLVAAIGLASAATFSSGNGTLAWLLGGVMLVAPVWIYPADRAVRRTQLRLLGVWGLALAVNAAIFIHGYHAVPQEEQLSYHASLKIMAVYVMAFIGSPYAFLATSHFSSFAAVVGMTLIVPTAVLTMRWLRRSRTDPRGALDLVLWGSMAAFTLLSGIIAAKARAGMGVEQAITSRYTSFAIYQTVALIGAAGVLLARRGGTWGPPRLAIVGVLVISAFSAAAYPDALRAANVTRIVRLQAKGAMLMVDLLPDNPQIPWLLHPRPPVVREQARIRSAAGWMNPPLIEVTDARELTPANPPRPQDVGQLERATPLSATQLGVSGWSLLPGRRVPADALFVSGQRGDGPDVPLAMAQIRVYRHDVAMRLGDACAISGWTATVQTAKLAALAATGTGPLRLHAWSLDVHTGRAARLGGELFVTAPTNP